MKKTVYLFDAEGKFVDLYKAQESPLESGVFIVPESSTDVPPPVVTASEFIKWDGTTWQVKTIPPPPPPDAPTQEEIDRAARAAQDLQDKLDAKSDSKFTAFISMSHNQAKQWAKDSFPSLTLNEQKDLGVMASAIALLARRL